MPAGTLDLEIDQYASYSQNFYWSTPGPTPTPVNLTGFTAKMQIRPSATSSTLYATLTTGNGGITLGTTNGLISLYISASTTATFQWVDGVYDLDLVSPAGFATRLLKGNVTVSPAVTTI